MGIVFGAANLIGPFFKVAMRIKLLGEWRYLIVNL